ncbi:FAD-binding oxidoreductase [Actinophytocola sp. KF-1]
MAELSRRALLTRAAVVGAGAVSAGTFAGAAPAAAEQTHRAGCSPFDPVTIQPGDVRYDSFLRGHNTRFAGRPERVTVAGSADDVVAALGRAVGAGRRVTVRSGGHCLENFTTTSDINDLIDLSQMSDVYFDDERQAFALGPGAMVQPLQGTLFKGWGVTMPSAGCSEVCVGGHILGGGYNFYSRIHGFAVDHLHAVEVVVVDAAGQPRKVVATRSESDPNRDLWWAHTGGGGGNFGIVTKYWLRSPGVASTDPSRLLPRPDNQRVRTVMWSWESLSQQDFVTIVRNYSRWFEQHSAPGTKEVQVWAAFALLHRAAGVISLTLGVGKSVEGGEAMLDQVVAAIGTGVGVRPSSDSVDDVPWYSRDNWYWGPSGRQKDKTADLRKSYTDEQLATIYRYLSDDSFGYPDTQVHLAALGGTINAVHRNATASPHRDSIFRVYFTPGIWRNPADDDKYIAWVRNIYRDVYATTGGVPVPNEINGGAYINYPDRDLADPEWNRSGVPWHTMYYGDNYARLQQVKRRYDPRSVFRHALSIQPAYRR